MNNSVHKGIIYIKEGPTLIGRGKKNCTQLKKMGEKKETSWGDIYIASES